MTAPLPEFAEEHSTATRLRLVLVGVLAGCLIVYVSKTWLFPALREFAAAAPCRPVFGLPGQAVLWYGIFVGVPLFSALLTAALMGRRGVRIVRDAQVPPIGEKVFRPTRIRRGSRAVLIGRLHMAACLPFCLLALWGFFQAQHMMLTMAAKPSGCERSHMDTGAV